MNPPRVLVVGATGAFGERLAAGLARAGFGLILAARQGARLAALRERLAPAGPEVATLAIDQADLDAARLAALKGDHPGLFAIADAAGPFQGRPPALPRAAIAAGPHCVDLADARDYVLGIRALDASAREAGVAILSGASSTPALSHAVLDRLTGEAEEIHSVAVAIAPGNRAPRGLSLVEAILTWAGRPVRVFRGGRWVEEPGWGRAGSRSARPPISTSWSSAIARRATPCSGPASSSASCTGASPRCRASSGSGSYARFGCWPGR
jgi:saccharopine dehydrogenase-like NADP-dependent oxidoreductase